MTIDGFARVVEALRTARRIAALTGAGVSAASGIPTFRGSGGLWKTYRPDTLATPAAFANNPRLVWEWYDWRRQQIRHAVPNASHEVLAAWTREWPHFTLITQNVDGLHESAGADRLVRLHGCIWELVCWRPCRAGRTPWRDDSVPLDPLPPTCPHCRGLARPAVVWFGEHLNPSITRAADRATACEVFLSIGTSSVVYPAAGLAHQAKERGALTVEINPDATDATDLVDVALCGRAEEILPRLAKAIEDAPA